VHPPRPANGRVGQHLFVRGSSEPGTGATSGRRLPFAQAP